MKAESVAVSADTTKRDLVEVFRGSGLTRLPVYETTLDTPLGLVHLKDFALQHGFTLAEDIPAAVEAAEALKSDVEAALAKAAEEARERAKRMAASKVKNGDKPPASDSPADAQPDKAPPDESPDAGPTDDPTAVLEDPSSTPNARSTSGASSQPPPIAASTHTVRPLRSRAGKRCASSSS